MKKKWISMIVAFVFIVANTSMAYALSPVAEVYYNVGTSSYDSSDFESQLNEAVKAKLIAAGVNPKYVSIMDASADPATVTDTTYVHSGYDSWYIGTGPYINKPLVETADYNHVQISNNGKTLTFYGYTAPAYKDFMLTSGSPTGKKIITFDMDESKVDYHSMEGGGFLFNTKVDVDGKLSGYAVLYVQGAVKVYQLNGVDQTALHNETNNPLSYTAGVTQIGHYTKGSATNHSIKIVATSTKVSMWDNGELIINGLTLDTAYGDEFGPIVSHVNHGCGIISIFAFDNMKLYSTSPKTLDVAVDNILWEPNAPLRYVVNINDDPSVNLDGGTNQSTLTGSFNNNGAQYVGVTDATYTETDQAFIDSLVHGGLHVDAGPTSTDIIDAIADRIVNQITTNYKDAILAIETAENKTDVKFNVGDSKSDVKNNLILEQDEGVTTVWSSDQPSIIAPDGTVTRPVITQSGTYVTLTATMTKDGLTSQKTFTVYVKAADPAPLKTLTATAGNGQVTLNFPALTGATSIVVEQSTDGKTFTPVSPVEKLDASSTSATITGLTNGTTYYFRLNVDSGFYTGVSNEVNIKPTAPPVTVPSNPEPSVPGPSVPVVQQPTMKTEVIVSDPANGGKVVQDPITKLVGDNLKVSGKIKSATGQDLNLPSVLMSKDGSFALPKVAPGSYILSLNVTAPNGEKLAGPAGKLIVDSNGNAKLSIDLVDPYGTILDEVTGEPVSGVDMQLYWADTELNRSKGRVPGTVVKLPELPDFSPNKNHNPQISTDSGQYGWMVYPDGDYYFLGEKNGYTMFDSRNDKREERFGHDSYIKGGLIHVGETIVKFNFSMKPKVKAEGAHKPYMVGYPDGTFKTDRGIVRSEVAAILSRLYTPAASSKKVSYSDVNAKHWAANAITKATNNKWMVGFGNNTFKPNKQITRAEFVKILTNLYSWDTVQDSSYTDVTGHWAEKAIATAEKQGILFDYTEKTFHPNQPITRLEVVRILNQLLDRKPWDIKVAPKWTDVPETHKNYSDIMEASIPHPFELFETGIENWK